MSFLLNLIPGFSVLKYGLIAVLTAGAFFAGWHTKSYMDIAAANKAAVAVQAKISAIQSAQAVISQRYETKLAQRQENAQSIQQVKTKIITRKIYLNQCFDADGLQLLNDARLANPASGSASGLAPALPAAPKPSRA
jgi:hypothetical protein